MHVNNIGDMLKHVRNHRRRLYTLGMEVNGPKLLKQVMFGMHDCEKFIFLPWLWKYYGGKGNKQKAHTVYTRMNSIGKILVNIVLFFLPYSKEQISRMKRFERIIDVIDRHCDIVTLEEFNLKKQRPLTNFIRIDDMPCAITFKKKWLDKFEHENHLDK